MKQPCLSWSEASGVEAGTTASQNGALTAGNGQGERPQSPGLKLCLFPSGLAG